MTWTDLFWGLVLALTANIWMRGVTNRNQVWRFWEFFFGTLLMVLIIIAVTQLA